LAPPAAGRLSAALLADLKVCSYDLRGLQLLQAALLADLKVCSYDLRGLQLLQTALLADLKVCSYDLLPPALGPALRPIGKPKLVS